MIRPGGTFLICNELGARTGESVWTEKVSGMTVYTAEQLTKLLLEAGFHDAQAHEAKTGWLCLTVRAWCCLQASAVHGMMLKNEHGAGRGGKCGREKAQRPRL